MARTYCWRSSLIRLAAVTAYAREADRLRAAEAGFDLHVAKPIDIGALVSAVGRLIPPAA